ncbi:SCO6880 family protein [Streptomyces rubellomurinus]|uniref:Membrane protein n=2 Tax=Streptomyces TaxID=1883 RepID=A0A0F2TD81_STRR3|nr:SCO6880 family protein [Streptomyces rubellomurinus]KJS59707.1 membrane protein [Streptomyces rubellomurinus]
MSTETATRTYFGWQQEKVNFLFGLSGQRAAMVGTGVLGLIWPFAISYIRAGLVTWPVSFVLFLLAFVRIAGRTVDEWAVAFMSFEILRFRGQNRFLSGAFAPRVSETDEPRLDLPGILAPLAILEADGGSGAPIAVIHHRLDRTYTAVARVRVPGIGLADSSRRDQRVANWGSLLQSQCTEGNAIIRIQALQRIVPESGAALQRWHADHVAAEAPAVAVDVTKSLLSTATLATSQREAYLAITMSAARAASPIKAAGGGDAGAAAVLVRNLRAMTSSIASADLQVESWLNPRELAEVMRTAFDPDSGRMLAERRAAATSAALRGDQAPFAAGVSPTAAGPSAAHAWRGRYEHDGAVSVTYAVHSWPKNKVYATALAPLLGEGKYRRTLNLHFEPRSPRAAEREIMQERTAREVAVNMRHKTGQIVPEAEKQALRRAEAQDQERAAGHGMVRYTAYCTVTVTDPADLEDACSELLADANSGSIELQRMWMAQDVGFAIGALPVGMGLPKKRAA